MVPLQLFEQGRTDYTANTAYAVCSDLVAPNSLVAPCRGEALGTEGKLFQRNHSQKGFLHREEVPCRKSPCREAPFSERRPFVEKDRFTERRPFQKRPQAELTCAQRDLYNALCRGLMQRGHRYREAALCRGSPMQRGAFCSGRRPL